MQTCAYSWITTAPCALSSTLLFVFIGYVFDRVAIYKVISSFRVDRLIVAQLPSVFIRS